MPETAKKPRVSRPTRHAPGTPEKIEVMRRRVAAGLPPCNPLDATFGADSPPRPPRRRTRADRTLPAGISKHKNRWRARVWLPGCKGIKLDLGLFVTIQEAVAAVEEARKTIRVEQGKRVGGEPCE